MDALIVIDVQNDFCPGVALAVPGGDEVIPIINRLLPQFQLVVATQDWHPAEHASFAVNHAGRQPGEMIELAGLTQILWPAHCVQNGPGAELHSELQREGIATIIRKGTDREIDSYSGFFDNGHRKGTGLGEFLKERGVGRVFLCGLATDYCVKFSALDAVELGFETVVIEDACRGVNLQPGDVAAAKQAMREAGVRFCSSAEVLADVMAERRPPAEIRFYQVGNPYGEFSNFAPFPIDVDGTVWPTSEHYFQASKFPGTPQAERIRRDPSPSTAAKLGRSRGETLRPDWEEVKEAVMRRALFAKFTQHARLRRMLLATGETRLIEHTKNDSYWGDGGDGSGRNRLGELLMELRETIRQGQGPQ